MVDDRSENAEKNLPTILKKYKKPMSFEKVKLNKYLKKISSFIRSHNDTSQQLTQTIKGYKARSHCTSLFPYSSHCFTLSQ